MTKIGAEITVFPICRFERLSPGSSLCQSGHYLIDYNRIYLCLYHHPGSPFTDGLVPFETSISTQAIDYMRLVAPGLFFQFNNNTFSGLYNGQGDSRTPFRTSAVGLIVNIILDPLLIYGIGPLSGLGYRRGCRCHCISTISGLRHLWHAGSSVTGFR